MSNIKLVTATLGLAVGLVGLGGTVVIAEEAGSRDHLSPQIGLTIRIDDGGISFSGRFLTSGVEKPGLDRIWASRAGNQPLGGRGVEAPAPESGIVSGVADWVRGGFVTARALRRVAIRAARRSVVGWAWRRIATKGPANADCG